ncbi:23S rRNA (pseudouridine(1915)-N(3))-methyltransferase RlmH, partial [Pseudomonas sp. FW305-130]
AELVERYVKRLAWPFKMTELPDTGGKMPPVEPGTRVVMLDETGQVLPSRDLAATLEKWRDGGVREARFLIGAADGFDDAQRAEADVLL